LELGEVEPVERGQTGGLEFFEGGLHLIYFGRGACEGKMNGREDERHEADRQLLGTFADQVVRWKQCSDYLECCLVFGLEVLPV